MAGKDGACGAEILLKERFTRVKADGDILTVLFDMLGAPAVSPRAVVAESSFAHRPVFYEDLLDKKVPFYQGVKARGQSLFYSRLNPRLKFLSHHYCHARSAAAMSPFEKALILVIDGSGNFDDAFSRNDPELKRFPPPVSRFGTRYLAECLSVYAQDGEKLTCLDKKWHRFRTCRFRKGKVSLQLSEGLGIFYETASRYIFNSERQAGKVMGLAAFGTPAPVRDRIGFLRELDWAKAFRGRSKAEWQASPHFRLYADVSASVQAHFEESVMSVVSELSSRYPGYRNLILAGGCALNCVANMKISDSGLFDGVYVPPFPSDEGISFGAAHHLRIKAPSSARRKWRPVAWDRQTASFGSVASAPDDASVREVFSGYPMRKPANLPAVAAELLDRGLIVGWFQGRSEAGPRALGCRSLLASPFAGAVKDRLNRRIKRREDFRPYGCSVLWESSHRFFAVKPGFDSPFMSFAPLVRPEYRRRLREVIHADETSRIQTVRREQAPLFYDTIRAFERRTGIGVVLNTSLNAMGEPIVETLTDLRRFFNGVQVDAVIAGDWLIGRPGKPFPWKAGRPARRSCRP